MAVPESPRRWQGAELAAGRMDPVLTAFRAQVVSLKHDLNAQAIAALSETNRTLQGDIARRVADLQPSIREADAFLSSLKT